MKPTSLTSVVRTATQQTMAFVAREVNTKKDKVLDKVEIEALQKRMEIEGEAFAEQSDDARTPKLPPQDYRMRMAIMHSLVKTMDDAAAPAVKLTTLRAALRKSYKELIANATGPTDGLMNGLGAMMSFMMLPDVALDYVHQQKQPK